MPCHGTGDWNRFDREDREPPDSHAVLALHEPAVREFMQAGFLVLMPGYKQEVIQLVLRAPCALEDALSEISDARSADNSERFDCLVPATPQPDISFGTVLAVPEWASVYGCCVVADLRLVDNRLFAYLINGRLNRSSLLCSWGLPMQWVSVSTWDMLSWKSRACTPSRRASPFPLCQLVDCWPPRPPSRVFWRASGRGSCPVQSSQAGTRQPSLCCTRAVTAFFQ